MFALIKMKYRMKRITADQVWAYFDNGAITREQAVSICGPRPV